MCVQYVSKEKIFVQFHGATLGREQEVFRRVGPYFLAKEPICVCPATPDWFLLVELEELVAYSICLSEPLCEFFPIREQYTL